MKEENNWKVGRHPRVDKSIRAFPGRVKEDFLTLIKEMQIQGPNRYNWPHYSKLDKGKRVVFERHHCHLNNGRPTYVTCWIVNKKEKIIEVN